MPTLTMSLQEEKSPPKRGRRRLLQDEEQRKARRKAQCKLNQRRYRARQRGLVSTLSLETEGMNGHLQNLQDYRDFLRGYFLLDAQPLTTWNDPRPMLVVKHFLRAFRSGFALHSTESSSLQESFVKLVCAPEMITQGSTTDGIEALLLQLKRYTSYHGTLEILPGTFKVVHAPIQEMEAQANEEKLTWVLEAKGAVRMRISRDTLIMRIVGQTIEPQFTATLHFDARAKVTKLDQHIDFAGAFFRILENAQDVATVLDGALISPFSELGLDPQGTAESALTRGSKQLSLKFILL
ncbi:uncharacterized protein PITG_15322 [Phytophthora infestans T30-4]|uniref:Bzip transcription factor n=1 Tax=Phytophthora infestans (strain T30-4) TaxID=403677 RepID=D0NQF7_PHYIT|nr:uncharacterized protein PITG_15322 [Phytophthora infestans T30-4]EEY62889.1 conserved hypothetical protein [Phytophthora infestans T30-4]|eukprot:XP_002898764.1 conserved hypothetical protein [Phytophthora infestans T30-4]